VPADDLHADIALVVPGRDVDAEPVRVWLQPTTLARVATELTSTDSIMSKLYSGQDFDRGRGLGRDVPADDLHADIALVVPGRDVDAEPVLDQGSSRRRSRGSPPS
jgi:hypothetical protein